MDATTGAQAAMPAQDLPQRPLFVFSGRLGEMFKIHIVNIALTIVTLGVYRFWAKTRMRKYLWSHIEVAGDGLEYTGTGKELFLGFLVVFGAIIVPIFVLPSILVLFIGEVIWFNTAAGAAQAVVIFLLLPVAIYRARRYRLSRTRWRGIRGALGGKAFSFALKYIAASILQGITMGLMTPTARNMTAHYIYNNVQVGDTPLTFDARPGPMYRKYWKAFGLFVVLLLLLIGLAVELGIGTTTATLTSGKAAFRIGGKVSGALGIAIGVAAFLTITVPYMWYNACETIYFVGETGLRDLRFALAMSPWGFVGFSIVNALIFVLTLGIGVPWIYKRMLDYFSRRVTVAGDLAAFSVHQNSDAGPRQGEGLADAFDPAGF